MSTLLHGRLSLGYESLVKATVARIRDYLSHIISRVVLTIGRGPLIPGPHDLLITTPVSYIWPRGK